MIVLECVNTRNNIRIRSESYFREWSDSHAACQNCAGTVTEFLIVFRYNKPGMAVPVSNILMTNNNYSFLVKFVFFSIECKKTWYHDTEQMISIKKYVHISTCPDQDMYRSVCKYNMTDELIQYIQTGDNGDVLYRGRLIKRITWEHERCSWRVLCFMYSSLGSIFQGILLDMWCTYVNKFSHFNAKTTTVASLLLGTQPKEKKTQNAYKKNCEICDERNTCHVGSQCPFCIEET